MHRKEGRSIGLKRGRHDPSSSFRNNILQSGQLKPECNSKDKGVEALIEPGKIHPEISSCSKFSTSKFLKSSGHWIILLLAKDCCFFDPFLMVLSHVQ